MRSSTRWRRLVWVWLVVALIGVLSCGDSPTTPTPPPPVVEEPEKAPSPPPPPPLWQQGDFLTFYCTGYNEPYYLGDYLHPDPRCVQEYIDRGYTDIWLSVSIDNFVATHDLLRKPQEFRAWVGRMGGLRVTPMVSCYLPDVECEELNFKVRGPWPQYVREFAAAVDDLVSAYAFGVEVWEWTSLEQLVKGVRELRTVSAKPVIIHFNQDDWGNDGLWDQILPLGGEFAMAFQYAHPHTRPFATPLAEIERRTPQILAWATARGIVPLAGEYAFEIPEAEARALGRRAVELGMQGCWNGC